MICSSQTVSGESLKVFLSRCGTTTVRCPLCKKCHYTTVPEHLHNKPVRAKCECGQSFPVLFDSRKYFRKEVKLPGEYWDTSGGQDLMTVTTLSICGAGFEARRGNLLVREGETIQIKFLPNSNDRNWIKLKAVVKRVKGNQIGVEFTELNDHQRKCIGFYLMPWSEYDCVKLNPPLPFPETLPVTLLSLLRPWRPSTTFCARFFEGEVWIKGCNLQLALRLHAPTSPSPKLPLFSIKSHSQLLSI